MNARYYVPYINRFLSADTIIPYPNDPQSFNRFSYTRNNPINSTDPTGHIDCPDLNEGCAPATSETTENSAEFPVPEWLSDEVNNPIEDTPEDVPCICVLADMMEISFETLAEIQRLGGNLDGQWIARAKVLGPTLVFLSWYMEVLIDGDYSLDEALAYLTYLIVQDYAIDWAAVEMSKAVIILVPGLGGSVLAVVVFVACQLWCDDVMDAAIELARESADLLARGLYDTFDPYNWAYTIIDIRY